MCSFFLNIIAQSKDDLHGSKKITTLVVSGYFM